IMRQIVIDHARHRSAGKRDGGVRITLHEQLRAPDQQDLDVLALDQALYRLASID
ncbi:MAG: RNA polymerase subunit sigma, partial [Xanthomonadales bacterium]|nr:RNA polymerase subunit sigma [Xanthomonadales bacterium]